ncbi:MAG: hypothetical protein Q9191_004380 [Dirinaria sp. TL-2023a]
MAIRGPDNIHKPVDGTSMAGLPSSNVLKMACFCQQVTGQITFKSSDDIRSVSVCHCTFCRRTSGALCTTTVSTLETPFQIEFDGVLQQYTSSSDLKLFFCATCGSSLMRQGCTGAIIVHTGIIQDPEETLQIRSQCCISETIDGGMSEWLDVPTSHQQDACVCPPELSVQEQPVTEQCSRSNTQAFCHCKGIGLSITPPSEESTQLYSPYSDLIVPFHSGSPKNEEDAKWWLRANGTKYFAGCCACRSCRLASGNDVQSWAFIPKINIRKIDGSPMDYSMGTLKQYESSKGVYRNFCGFCGATIFWHDLSRPDLIDVSAGLIHARSGARAEELLEWATERVSFKEEAQNKVLVAKLGAGLRAWSLTSGF